jgi:hypothetical protein
MKSLIFPLIFAAALFIGGCNNPNSVEPVNNSETTLMKSYDVPKEVHRELQALKAATAKYHNIEHALADGYENIHVYVPGMGHHFLNFDLLDGTFDVTKPEILVYRLEENGKYRLVAAEFATPLTEPAPPEGFTGSMDVWVPNTNAGIWALHAWVWSYNPAGVFAGINPNEP